MKRNNLLLKFEILMKIIVEMNPLQKGLYSTVACPIKLFTAIMKPFERKKLVRLSITDTSTLCNKTL